MALESKMLVIGSFENWWAKASGDGRTATEITATEAKVESAQA